MRLRPMILILLAGSICFAHSNSNPDISVNFLGLYLNGSGVSGDPKISPHKGFSLQEAEMQFLSDVDAYLRANALFSIAQDDQGVYGIDPEEVYVETISLPKVTFRAGKFKMALGKHNQLHTHAYPFLDAPLIQQKLIGREGLNESGLSAAALLPTSWYSEITLQAFSLNNDALYNSKDSGDIGGLAHFKNLFDINDDLTLELGLSTTSGKNQFEKAASAFGADFTLKWRPSEGGKYHAFIWSTEYLDGQRPGLLQDQSVTNSPSAKNLAGVASWVQYQFAQRWWAQLRYEYLGTTHSPGAIAADKQSYLVGFFPTEFSGVRLQYDHTNIHDINRPEDAIGIQYNITIGAHPAHAY
jgi:hypothetical protein